MTETQEVQKIYQQAANKMIDQYVDLATKHQQANARIAELEGILATILSIPAVCDSERQHAKDFPKGANAITDARAILDKKYS